MTAFSPVFTSLLSCALGLLLLLPRPARPATPVPAGPSGTVTWVYDADTLEIAPHGTVRLLGIDAPEKKPSSRDAKFVSLGIPLAQLRSVHAQGLAWCIRHVKGEQVSLDFDKSRRDRYGRLLAYVRLADGRLLNRVLLEDGLVIVYRRFPFRFKNEFLAAENAAKLRRAGLWSTLPPDSQKPKNK